MRNEKKDISGRISSVMAELASVTRILKGSLSKVMLGKRTKGAGSKVVYLLTWKGEGNKTRTVYVKKDQVTDVRRMICNYRKARELLEKVVELNLLAL
jgi:hypothetical protein